MNAKEDIMYEVVSDSLNQHLCADTLFEAQTIKGREYNLYLAKMLERDLLVNPIRENTEFSAYIIDNGKRIEWRIRERRT